MNLVLEGDVRGVFLFTFHLALLQAFNRDGPAFWNGLCNSSVMHLLVIIIFIMHCLRKFMCMLCVHV